LLKPVERFVAGGLALALLVVALRVFTAPPERRVALSNCPNAAAGCVVTVDTEVGTLAVTLAAIASVAALVAILGVRFRSIEAGGVKLGGGEDKTIGLPRAEPQHTDMPPEPAHEPRPVVEPAGVAPVEVELKKGLGTPLGLVPVAVTRLDRRMPETDASYLRDYQSARRHSQQSYFLVHILGPATAGGQKYSVALKVVPHRDASAEIRSASFYLGRAWGNKVYPGERAADGRYGIVTEAYGPFLALCEVEFADGSRIVLDHYCDFEMGGLVRA
jgi:hypothetical protein